MKTKDCWDLNRLRKWIIVLYQMPPGSPKHELALILENYAKAWGEDLAERDQKLSNALAHLSRIYKDGWPPCE